MNKETYYSSGNALKLAEEDNFKEGCLPENSQRYEVDIKFKSKTLKGLIEAIKEHYEINEDDLSLNSCEEEGRLDINIHEDGDGNKANKEDYKQWKKGNKKLWYCVYSYNITKITEEGVKL